MLINFLLKFLKFMVSMNLNNFSYLVVRCLCLILKIITHCDLTFINGIKLNSFLSF